MIGLIADFCFSPPPAGWLECGGQAISRTTYAELHRNLAAVGYPFGNGDGSTTFNIPDLRGRVRGGRNTLGGATENRLVNDTIAETGVDGSAVGNSGGTHSHALDGGEHAVEVPDLVPNTTQVADGTDKTVLESVSYQLTPHGSPHNNVQPTLILIPCIWTGVGAA